MSERSILLLGLFVNKGDEKSNIRTVEDRLAAMFVKRNIPIIVSSTSTGKFLRLVDTLKTVISKRKKYDIVIVPLFGTWPSFLWQEVMTRSLKVLQKKIVLCIHGGSIQGRVDKGAKRFNKALQRANVLIAPSGYLLEYFQKKNFDVHLIENPIDLSGYQFNCKTYLRPRIIWMRAFTKIYNPEMAIRVAKRLSEKFSNFQMVMAGKDGALMSSIKRMSEMNGLNGKIIFPGYINQQQKLQFARDYDIYICTNKIDNAPVSIIEFMGLGLPVVSVNVGGIPYLISHEENGLLIDDDDDEAMCFQIERLIQDASLAKKISQNAYKYVQQYSEKNICNKWKALIDDLEIGKYG